MTDVSALQLTYSEEFSPFNGGVRLRVTLVIYSKQVGHGVAQLIEALRYKSEGPGSIPDGVIGLFH